MKWRTARRSAHVEDHRRLSGAGKAAGGGLAAMIIAGVGLLLFGTEPNKKDASPDGKAAAVERPKDERALAKTSAAKDTAAASYLDDPADFARVTLAYTEDVWTEIFASGAFKERGKTAYKPATVRLYEKSFKTKCGEATVTRGPFYCPLDTTVYLDPSFYREMAKKYDAPGDFAAAYVIAHEIAHHVQFLSGHLGEVFSKQISGTKTEAKRLSVRVELQADCYAGLWARKSHEKARILEPGDIKEALRAAHQFGDDMIQRMGGQKVDPGKYTHGSAEQRMRWFKRGFETGEVSACDTFKPRFEDL